MLRACLPAVLCSAFLVGPVEAQDAIALRERHALLREQLDGSRFGRPLHVESSESAAQKGEIFAAIEHPFGVVKPALGSLDHWCDILILHMNMKYCEASSGGQARTLTIFVARKREEQLDKAHRADLGYEVSSAADYLRVELGAENGPFGTRAYRIGLEAAPLDARRTFLHLWYSYEVGVAARIATQVYLATAGRDKVGFSIVERLPDGQPVHVRGERGVVERNAMRYYLAIEAYLGALGVPQPQRLEKRLRDWYAATERHRLQLHELERDEYLEMKRAEAKRQMAGGQGAAPR